VSDLWLSLFYQSLSPGTYSLVVETTGGGSARSSFTVYESMAHYYESMFQLVHRLSQTTKHLYDPRRNGALHAILLSSHDEARPFIQKLLRRGWVPDRNVADFGMHNLVREKNVKSIRKSMDIIDDSPEWSEVAPAGMLYLDHAQKYGNLDPQTTAAIARILRAQGKTPKERQESAAVTLPALSRSHSQPLPRFLWNKPHAGE
jgi:hypothetical protein